MRLVEQIKTVLGLAHADRSANTYNPAAGHDTLGFDDAVCVVKTATLASGSTLTVKLQQSPNGTDTWTDILKADGVTPVQVVLTQAGGNSDDIQMLSARLGGRANRKRYVRANCVVANANAAFDVVWLLSNPHNLPVVNAPAAVLD